MNETRIVRMRIPQGQRMTTFNLSGLPSSVLLSDNGIQLNLTCSRSGVSFPAWRDAIRKGTNATTPFSGTLRWSELRWGRVISRRSKALNTVECDCWGSYPNDTFPSPYSGSIVTADNLALRGLYRKLRSTRTQFQGGVFLGELRETIQMLRSPAKSLRTAVGNYFANLNKRLPRTKPSDRKKVISDTWLEYSFGWNPFINDISEGLKAIRKIGETDKRLTIQHTGVEELSEPYTQANAGWGSDHFTRIDAFLNTEISVRYKVGLKIDVQVLSTPREFERFGFVKSQIVPTLWELTPWSFLVDYFTNIGDLVDATATNTSNVTWACKTVRTTRKLIWNLSLDTKTFYNAFPNGSITGFPGGLANCVRTVSRSSINSIPLPRFALDVPGRPTQWLNMAALAVARRDLLSFLNPSPFRKGF